LNDYEILLMLDPDVPENTHAEILARTRELVEKDGGTWESHDAWGRRRLAYEIDHKAEGVYHLLTFSCDPPALDEVSRVLKITDGVMRHMATRRPRPHRRATARPLKLEVQAPAPAAEEAPAAEAEPAPAAEAEPAAEAATPDAPTADAPTPDEEGEE
jgi:small subunit ribosomal protein S6